MISQKVGSILFTAAIALTPVFAFAENGESSDVAEFKASLKYGQRGDEVKALQALLAADADLYPEGLITGFFGNATAKAVRKFQQKHGFEQVGFVGPKTRAKLNELLQVNPIAFEAKASAQGGTNVTTTANEPCVAVPPGHLIAPGWLRKNGTNPIISVCQKLPPGIAKKLGLSPGNGNPGTTTPDTTAPSLSSIATSVSSNSVTVTWTTNEFANGMVTYGTTTSYGSAVANASLTLNHSLQLSGLTPSTIYHFQVKSADAAGNVASSSDMTVTTSAVADATSPIISAVAAALGSTTASIMWNTNEAATSRVYYGTTTPLTLSSALQVNSSSLVSVHSMPLSGLATSTTYYYVIVSSDASNNTSTSTESSFTTLSI